MLNKFIFCVLLVWSYSAYAIPDLAKQRADFQNAERLLQTKQLQSYTNLKNTLKDYPLYPYLILDELDVAFDQKTLPTRAVHDFFQQYPGFLSERLRTRWLRLLAQRNEWDIYTADYQPQQDVGLQCYAIYARYQHKKQAKILNDAKPLWLSASSQPKECDPLFKAWMKTSYFNTQLVWDRIILATDNNQLDMVKLLKSLLPPKEQGLIDALMKVQNNPTQVTAVVLAKPNHPFKKTIARFGVKKLLRQDPEQGIDAWKEIQTHLSFSSEETADLNRYIAIDLATSQNPAAAHWLHTIPKQYEDQPLREWRIRYALSQQNWGEVLRDIESLPPAEKSLPGWQYWQARALIALNRAPEAVPYLQQLSTSRQYYGLLACDQQKLSYPITSVVIAPPKAVFNTVRNKPGIARAIELYVLDRYGDARLEWEYAMKGLNEQELQAAAIIAQQLHWYDRAIFTAAKTKQQDNLDLRFPLAYSSSVLKAAKKNQLDPAWIFAVARQESAFIYDARSTANALGIMQVRLGSAKEIAKKAGVTVKGENDLLNTDVNIQLGTTYLKKMLQDLDNNPILATAGYNAGPSRVAKWLPDNSMPADIWIETIPYRETRNYVQNVLTYVMIYQHQLGESSKLYHQFQDVKK